MNSRHDDSPLRLFRFSMLREDPAEPGRLENLEPRLLMSGDGGPLVWGIAGGGNGHTYEVVLEADGISWEDARLEAEKRGGYLVTITSQAENDFVFELIDDASYWFQLPVLGVQAHGPWIGAFRPMVAMGGPAEDWQWVSGEQWAYTNEPDRDTEHYALFAASGQLIDSVWKNWENDNSRLRVISYVVEYDVLAPANEPPQFATVPVGEAVQGERYRYEISATDADGDVLSFAGVNLPDWLTLEDHGDGAATLSGTPTGEHVGVADVIVSVTDGEDTVEQAFRIDIASNEAGISGVVWADANDNGVRDTGETGLAGWTIYIDANDNGVRDEGEAAAVTADDGGYRFEGIEPGDHMLRTQAPVDLAMFEQFSIQHRRLWSRYQTTNLADGDAIRRTDLDARSFLLNMESGDDNRFDDLVMKVSFADDGSVMLEVVSVDRRGCFHLLNAGGQAMVRNLGRTWFGQSAQLHGGWRASVASDDAQRVSAESGDEVTGVDFGLVEEPAKTPWTHSATFKLKSLIERVLFAVRQWQAWHGGLRGWNGGFGR